MKTLDKCKLVSIIIVTFILVVSCENREWDNPYDSDCPTSEFTPYGLEAEQIDNSSIELSWITSELRIDGFYIERKEENTSWIKVSQLINKELQSWIDNSFLPGTDYEYRIYAIAGEKKSEYSLASITTEVNLPEVNIISIESTTPNSIICTCKIVFDGGSEITKKGVCWNLYGSPTDSYSNNTIISDSEENDFEIEIINLNPATQYYIRSFAYNDKGRSYSNEVTTTTKSTIPTVNTIETSNITRTSFVSGGNVINDGGSPVTSRGVCWNKIGNPTIEDSKTIDGGDIGQYSSSIDNLEMGTQYYIRAYATNQNGTNYGDAVISSTVAASVPELSTLDLVPNLNNSATLNCSISDDGGLSIIEKGFCWNTINTPTIEDNKLVIDDSSFDLFDDITNLNDTTTYYVRAYAINSMGIAYSNEKSFYSTNRLVETWFDGTTFYNASNYPNINYKGNIYYYPIISENKMTWYQAIDYCSNIVAYGYSDWVLPNSYEISVIQDNPEITIPDGSYWTFRIGDNSESSLVTFYNNGNDGSMNNTIPKTSPYFVACIRKEVVE